MKNLTYYMKKLMAIILPLFFLSSCYEIVYVSQETDATPGSIVRPDVCVQVYTLDDKPTTPYFGFLAHKSWKVADYFIFTREYNGTSTLMGRFHFNNDLSGKMELIDPAPAGYFWWVGISDASISMNGVYHVYPLIQVGNHNGKYAMDYMLGDARNGLNVMRSEKLDVCVVHAKAPSHVTATSSGKEVLIKWKEPVYSHNLMGYQVIRNGTPVIDQLITETFFTDKNVPPGSHTYVIQPEYAGGAHGYKSNPAKICYSPCGTSMDFDGFDDKLVIFDDPSLRLKMNLTLEAWIKLGYGDLCEPRIISKGQNGVGYELLLTQLKEFNSLEFRLPFAYLKSTTPLMDNVWYHVAAVYDGKTMKLFINGKPDCVRMAHGYIVNTHYPLTIGKCSMENSGYFNGDIDNARIWNVARTEAEIFDNFSSLVSPEEEGLVGAWRMSEGCKVMTCDNSSEGNDAFLSGSCWCAEVYPFVEETSNQTSNALVIPVMNYRKQMQVKPPHTVLLEFKINPKLLKFERIITENTQLDGYVIKSNVWPDGTIKVKAVNNDQVSGQGDVLIYVDVKPLQPHVVSQLKFNACSMDGVNLRVASAKVIATALPEIYKTDIEESGAEDLFMTLYPNPATTMLNVELGTLESPAELSVVNMSGQEVYRYTLQPNMSNTIHKIELLGFSKGIYLINLQQNEQVHVKKFAVN